ncbi:allophanate hydrolase [Falsiroseomonas oryziterrae]|uniref:allophanate hydrolase n=1 Tax=Falsiroseomonas oryziterrae TaxID=2911368 RepID=UPI001F02FFF0|nr:allophanate hydrolase [Roseomonas sp. NPKOSM-4]
MSSDADLSLDRASLHAAYAAGRLRPEQVVALIHRRIATLGDPGIFIHLVPETQATATAAALPAFDPARYPLWGLPVAMKDNIDIEGLPTTAGCPGFAYVAKATAPAVLGLLDAGAVLIGKTNLDQFATGLVGVRTPYPVPRNAFDPARVPGGSSSGSAVAVAQGLATLSLGTDTAGSGRVPAALNNLVGLKPSLGAVSSRGVVPACRTLDCVSVFALSVEDAWAGFEAIAGEDQADPFSRPIAPQEPRLAPPIRRLGVPRRPELDDEAGRTAWAAAVQRLSALGVVVEEVDLAEFHAVARLLYEGPWVAERAAAVGEFALARPDAVHPVTRDILAGASRFSAVDAFRGLYLLAELRRRTEPMWSRVDALAVPSVPCFPTLADLAADPLGPNARLGTYTNFVNLLDLAALAVPGPFRPDGLPAGLTLIGPRGSDAALAAFGARFQAAAQPRLGATTARRAA